MFLAPSSSRASRSLPTILLLRVSLSRLGGKHQHISVTLLPSSHRLCSLLKHASQSSTFILAVHLELMLIYVMHGIFFINLNSQFNLICKLSNLRCYLCISSCLIHFCLACFFCQQHSSQITSSSTFETIHKHIISHSQNFYLSF